MIRSKKFSIKLLLSLGIEMPAYRMTPEAREDLVEIARYTVNTWGDAQLRRYRDQLASCFGRIGRGQIPPRRLSQTLPDVRVVRCEHHYVFYLEAVEKTPAIILAVPHENMDCLTRIKSRLE